MPDGAFPQSFMGTWDPRKLIVHWKGVPFKAWGDDMLEITHENEIFTFRAGRDGGVIRSFNPNHDLATMTVTLLPNSPTAKFIEAEIDRDTRTGQGFGPLSISERMSGFNGVSPFAFVSEHTDFTAGEELEDYEYMFVLPYFEKLAAT